MFKRILFMYRNFLYFVSFIFFEFNKDRPKYTYLFQRCTPNCVLRYACLQLCFRLKNNKTINMNGLFLATLQTEHAS